MTYTHNGVRSKEAIKKRGSYYEQDIGGHLVNALIIPYLNNYY